MSNLNIDNIDRLLREVRDSLTDCELYHNSPSNKNDSANLENLILAAIIEANRLDASELQEIYDVKPLHDRIHSIVLALRVARNTLERLEAHAQDALDKARMISHQVEEPYDDHEL